MFHHPLASRAAILALAYGVASVHAGEIYKTVDANGVVTYSDHADPNSPQTSVVELQDSRYPPHEIHFCWTNCFTLIYDGQAFHRTDGTDETWTVTQFTADSFILHRHSVPAKWNGFSADVTYAGRVAHDRLIGVTVNGTPASGIDASWGIALNTLPGSNAERDGRFEEASAGPAALAPGSADSPPLEAAPAGAMSAATPPPPIPDDPQPEGAQDGYLWTPGYWNWGGSTYVWVPGAWVQPPAIGLLWTPAYWRFVDSRYFFHPGYWGPHVGFYGGINYGHGYYGTGYAGGHWVGNSFAYNSSVNHLNPNVIRNTYVEAVHEPVGRSFASYNGGPGGTTVTATNRERLAAIEAHAPEQVLPARTRISVVAAQTPVQSTAQAPVQSTARAPVPSTGQASVRPSASSGSAPARRTPSPPHAAAVRERADSQEQSSRAGAPASPSVTARVSRSTAAKAPPKR